MKVMRWAEYLFLFAGLIAVDYFIWVNAVSSLSQDYESWSFEQDLRGKPASLQGFVHQRWNLFRGLPEKTDETNSPGTAPAAPFPAEPSRPAAQAVIGRVDIPRLKLSVTVREGVDTGTLRRAVGHVPSTALPGEAGNVALAGHRDTYFSPLEHIQSGDHIEVETRQGVYEYVVDSTQIVSPKDVWVLRATNHPTLTLVTCFPFHYFGSAPRRFIVRATQVTSEASVSRGAAEVAHVVSSRRRAGF
jgi:LPXTG-site transpeptidase (sortase) family protein